MNGLCSPLHYFILVGRMFGSFKTDRAFSPRAVPTHSTLGAKRLASTKDSCLESEREKERMRVGVTPVFLSEAQIRDLPVPEAWNAIKFLSHVVNAL